MSNQESQFTCIDPEVLSTRRAPNFVSLLNFLKDSNYELIDDASLLNSWDGKYTFYPENLFNSFPKFASLVIENQIDLKNPNFTSLNHEQLSIALEFYNQISKAIFFFQDSYRKQQKMVENES